MKKFRLHILLVVAFCLAVIPSHARWYDADTGRFRTMDSYEGNAGDPVTLHKYVYCQNNPVLYVDPSGHEIEYDAGKGLQAHWLFFTYCETRGIPKYFDKPISTAYPSFLGKEGANLRPDVNDVRHGRQRWFELKPITHRNSEKLWGYTQIQLASYTEALGKIGVPPGNQEELVPAKTPIGFVFGDDGKSYLCTIYAAAPERPGLVYYALSKTDRERDMFEYFFFAPLANPTAARAIALTAGRVSVGARAAVAAVEGLGAAVTTRASLGAVTKF